MKKFKNFLTEKYFKSSKFTEFGFYPNDLNSREGSIKDKYYSRLQDATTNRISSLHDKLHAHYKLSHSEKNQDKRDSIFFYTLSHGADTINNTLHSMYSENKDVNLAKHFKKNTDEMAQHLHQHIKSLDEHLSTHAAPETFHVYTGLKEDPRKSITGVREVEQGNNHYKAILPSYTSTSISAAEAVNFTRGEKGNLDGHPYWRSHILKIEIPKGSKHGSYIAPHAEDESEHEFLLKRGAKIHIHNEPEIINDGNRNEYHVWHAKIVN